MLSLHFQLWLYIPSINHLFNYHVDSPVLLLFFIVFCFTMIQISACACECVSVCVFIRIPEPTFPTRRGEDVSGTVVSPRWVSHPGPPYPSSFCLFLPLKGFVVREQQEKLFFLKTLSKTLPEVISHVTSCGASLWCGYPPLTSPGIARRRRFWASLIPKGCDYISDNSWPPRVRCFFFF